MPGHEEASARRAATLIEAAPDAMLLVDAAGHIVLLNREAERLFGYTREELLGHAVEELVPDRFRPSHPAHRADYHADRRTRPMGASLDLSCRRKDGSEFPAEISLSPVELDGVPLTTAAVRDVTARRRSDAKFRALLEAAPDAMVIIDPRGRIVLVNSQTELLFGYGREELLGRPVEILIPGRFRGAHAGYREGYFREPRARAMGSGLDLYGVRKNGTEFPVEISLAPLETEEGTLVSSAIRDVSARKAIENALKLANKELESFSYSVAHDLRAPLRGMSGFAQVLLDDYGSKLEPDALDCLNEIRTNAVRMGALIDALLSLSRVVRTEPRRGRADLSAMAREIVKELSAAEPDRRVDLVVAEGLVADEVDPRLARTLLQNLLGNAWKFTAHASAPRIELGITNENDGRAFFVKDNGAGFDEAHAARLFGAFQRLHTVAEFSGTGIGLATAQRIVHRHGGRIWGEGKVGEGATFWFTLPPLRGGDSS